MPPSGSAGGGGEPNDANPWRYCGEYFDKETGTYYLRARYYNPANGRFSSEDPIRDGLNWYTYCMGNPLRFVDPSGLKAGPGSGSDDDIDYSDMQQWQLLRVLQQAMNRIDQYLAGEDIENLDWALKVVAKYGPQTSIGKYEGKNSYDKYGNKESYVMGKSYDRFDTAILGFTNYWNLKLKLVGTDDEIDANLVKAIMMQESSLGNSTSEYVNRDVMGSLRDVPEILAYGTSEKSNYPIKGGYAIFKQLFDNNGNWVSANATPLMSIAGGIRIFAFKNMDLAKYNGGGHERASAQGSLTYYGRVMLYYEAYGKGY